MRVTGVVLAGGQSRRMGCNKAQLQRLNQSMLAFCCDLLETLPLHDIVISTHHPHTLPFRSIPDKVPHCGPLGGIHAIAHAVFEGNVAHVEDALLCLPVDLPLMESCFLEKVLFAGLSSLRVTHYAEQPFPLFLPISTQVLHALDARVLSPQHMPKQYQVRDFCKSLPVHTLAPVTDHAWHNANTPSDWLYAMRHLDPSRERKRR